VGRSGGKAAAQWQLSSARLRNDVVLSDRIRTDCAPISALNRSHAESRTLDRLQEPSLLARDSFLGMFGIEGQTGADLVVKVENGRSAAHRDFRSLVEEEDAHER